VQGQASFDKSGVGMWRPFHLACLAHGYQATQQTDKAIRTLDDAIALAKDRQGDAYAAELYRLKGEWILATDSAATAEAETCFHQAIQIAQQQGSRSMQLRAMTSLATLWHGQGRTQEAQMTLQTLYSTFTEGLQTPDLLRAREVLDSLR